MRRPSVGTTGHDRLTPSTTPLAFYSCFTRICFIRQASRTPFALVFIILVLIVLVVAIFVLIIPILVIITLVAFVIVLIVRSRARARARTRARARIRTRTLAAPRTPTLTPPLELAALQLIEPEP